MFVLRLSIVLNNVLDGFRSVQRPDFMLPPLASTATASFIAFLAVTILNLHLLDVF